MRTFLVSTVAVLLLNVTLLLHASSVAASSPDAGHVASLPPLSAGTLLDAAPGEPPSPGHPRGTILIAASLARCGPAVYEWDVAHARVMREACLGGGQANVRVVRRGGVLLVLTVGPDVVLRQFDITSFKVTGWTRLGEYESSGIAADDGLTAVLSGPPLASYADTFTVTTSRPERRTGAPILTSSSSPTARSSCSTQTGRVIPGHVWSLSTPRPTWWAASRSTRRPPRRPRSP